MKTKMYRALLLVAMLFFLDLCSSDSSEEDFTSQKVETYTYSDTELALFSKINNYRASKGLSELDQIKHISFKSSEHNLYMINNGVIGHHYFDQRAANIKQVLNASKVSENIAYNYNSNEGVLNAWLNSEGHKAVIEGDFTHFGASITINPVNGRKYYTNIFMKR